MKYFANKSDGISIGGNHYKDGQELLAPTFALAGEYAQLIKLGWVRTEGKKEVNVIKGKSSGKKTEAHKEHRQGRKKNTKRVKKSERS